MASYRLVPDWPQLPDGWELHDVPGVAVDGQDRVFLFARYTKPVIALDASGAMRGFWGEGRFTRPHAVSAGPDGALYFADDAGHAIQKTNAEGRLMMTLGTPGRPSDTGAIKNDYRTVKRGAGPFNYPTDLAVASSGDLYASDGYGNARVHCFTADGRLKFSWGEPGTEPGQFNLPHGVAVGADGRVYVADRQNDRVQVFSADGNFQTQWGGLRRPTDIYIDPSGQFFVSELGNGEAQPARVSIFDRDGRPRGAFGEGDLKAAHGVAGDSHGAIYVGEVAWTIFRNNPPAGSRGARKFVAE
ncbi:MAG TPA: peptidyl-alpha-hydroxyglycine alpha-amidating lyase family protein [Bacillota bacterium]|nr:peptidyl-alpha-hydroxyglycine alpha-amidating lyase family protein [Bacillota bacterium]